MKYFFKKRERVTTENQTSKMSYSSVLNAIDVLVEYPDLQKYIKEFNGHGGFMFNLNRETDPQGIAYKIQLEQLLDANGMHSGGSWGCLMRSLQAVYNGALTREELENKVAAEKCRMHEWEAAYQLRQAAAAQVRAEYRCEEEAAEEEGSPLKFNCRIVNKE
ncbi:MAG: hypothetical protein EBY16_09555 [Gammaproteobacteria bacterium]|nr:hypothetical protein [Gammaproteobacteria bacterium]